MQEKEKFKRQKSAFVLFHGTFNIAIAITTAFRKFSI